MPVVFVSYSSHDSGLAERLARDLIANGVQVWYDKWEIFVGHDIVERVYDGIKKADYLAIVLTENALKSKWVREELNYARVQEIEHGNTSVLPLVFEPLDLPAPLRTKKYADFKKSYDEGLRELLRAVGVTSKMSDALLSLIHVLDNWKDKRVRGEWDIFSDAFNRCTVQYFPGNIDRNRQALRLVRKKVAEGLDTTNAMVMHDSEALAFVIDHGAKTNKMSKKRNAWWRDVLFYQLWEIAHEVLEEQRDVFLENLDTFEENFSRRFKVRVVNEIGPSLANTWLQDQLAVVYHAMHVLLAVLDFQRVDEGAGLARTKTATKRRGRVTPASTGRPASPSAR